MTKTMKTFALSIALCVGMAPTAFAASADYTLNAPEPVVSQQVTLTTPELHFAMGEAPHGTTIFGLPVNEGPIDRSIRGAIALGLIGTGIYGLSTGNISTPVSATLLGVSAIPTLTAATGYCPLYSLFGVEYTF